MVEKQLITVKGTSIFEGQVKKLHVVTCECGNKIVRAQNESGIKQYIENPKYKAKCCDTLLKYQGEKFFKGDEIITDEEALAASDFPPTETQQISECITKSQTECITTESNDQNKIESSNQEQGTPETPQKEKKNDVNGLIKNIKRMGVTNFQMIPAMNESFENKDNMKALYEAHKDVFLGSIRYLPVKVREAVEAFMKEHYPQVELPKLPQKEAK